MTARSRVLADAVAQLGAADPVVAALAERHGPPRLTGRRHGRTHFEALTRSILYQQLAGSAASAIHQRFLAAVGGEATPEAVLACPLERLRECGLSGAKAAAVRDLAAKVHGGELRLAGIGRLPDEAIVERLVQVRGVGRWTAEMFLIFTLGRLDVWPTGDFGVRAGYAHAWGLPQPPAPKELHPLGERFRPYRSVVAWYCWRAADQRRATSPPAAATAAPAPSSRRG